MDVRIERAKPEDAAGIQKVIHTTWLETYPNEEHSITREDIAFRHQRMLTPQAVEKHRNAIANMTDNELTLVAKYNEEVVGMCYLEKLPSRNQLFAIYILPEYQKQGIGSMFWRKALEFFDPKKDTYVEVVEYNENAKNFYKKLGFVDTGRRFAEERFRMRNGAILPEMEMIRKAV